ncbi:hypothetical protein V3C99_011703 [Haemonchus contortus]|uniref:DUF1758 domain-containing protein n=1 Tax=Haemonchus contortus TaxID=6289 RepID=A0A7I4Y720_HAECO
MSHLRSQALKDQRSLFEQIQVIIQQLRQKGEQVDNQWMMKNIFSKFPEVFQRKILMKKRSVSSNLQPISMQILFNLMEDVISGEEMIQVHLEKPSKAMPSSMDTHKTTPFHRKRTLPCMYCKGDHKPAVCEKFKTPQERAQYLRERNLCQLCVSAHHATAECSRQPCFLCHGPLIHRVVSRPG